MSTTIDSFTPTCVRYQDDLRAALEHLPVQTSAPLLLGWHLVHGPCRAALVEVEAYWDTRDPGSHAWRGPTPRTQVMYGPVGVSYVYFTYGNHWLLNVTARPPGEAAAILIRAAMPLEGTDLMRSRRPLATADTQLLSGPGKLTQALGLNGSDQGQDMLDPHSALRLEPGPAVGPVLVTRRVGLASNRGPETPWRFVDGGRLEWCSAPRPRP